MSLRTFRDKYSEHEFYTQHTSSILNTRILYSAHEFYIQHTFYIQHPNSILRTRLLYSAHEPYIQHTNSILSTRILHQINSQHSALMNEFDIPEFSDPKITILCLCLLILRIMYQSCTRHTKEIYYINVDLNKEKSLQMKNVRTEGSSCLPQTLTFQLIRTIFNSDAI